MQETSAQQRAEWRELGLQLLAQVGVFLRCLHLVGWLIKHQWPYASQGVLQIVRSAHCRCIKPVLTRCCAWCAAVGQGWCTAAGWRPGHTAGQLPAKGAPISITPAAAGWDICLCLLHRVPSSSPDLLDFRNVLCGTAVLACRGCPPLFCYDVSCCMIPLPRMPCCPAGLLRCWPALPQVPLPAARRAAAGCAAPSSSSSSRRRRRHPGCLHPLVHHDQPLHT
jgi:hypothetical protein